MPGRRGPAHSYPEERDVRPLETRPALTHAITALLLLVSAAIIGCSESKAPVDPLDMLLDDTAVVRAYDFNAISEGEAGDAMEDSFESYWDATFGNMGILMHEAESLTVGVRSADRYQILKGEFDFEYVREDLSDGNYDSDDYRGYEVWEGGGIRGAPTVVLIEESGVVLAGDDDAVQDMLRSLARGLSARDGAMAETLRAMDRAGAGWVVAGQGECHDELRGCEATATSVSAGELFEFRITRVLLFRDERTAESERDDAEELWEEVEIDSITVDAEHVIGVSTVDEDDFADVAAITNGILNW